MQKIDYSDLLSWHQAMELDEIMICAEPQPKNLLLPNQLAVNKTSDNEAKEEIMPRPKKTNIASTPHISSSDLVASDSANINAAIVEARKLADNCQTLDELRAAVMSFEGCALKKGALNTVFGDGVTTARVMLIGEAPGATEDEQGIPFCGESGKLLANMLKTIGLSREENFYITNTVFYRPPANRQPTQDEINICRPFVEKHIALIKPKLLILVGSTAVTSLLGNNFQISKIRREYYHYKNDYLEDDITTTALFHPAYLLRQPMQKKTTWYDLLKIKEYISQAICYT